MKSKDIRFFALAVVVALCCWAMVPIVAQEKSQTGVDRGNNIFYMGTTTAVHADISPPLRELLPVLGGPPRTEKDDPSPPTPCGPIDGFDPVAQTYVGSGSEGATPKIPAPTTTFNGFGNILGYQPPDPNGDVGPNHIVMIANSTIAVYSRTGTLLWGPSNTNTIWSGFGGDCQTYNDGDPVVLYDQFADRWLVSQFTATASPYYNCVALSSTADPTGTWQRYAFSNGTSFPDYPKYGIWRDAYYFTTRNTSGSTGQGAYAINRAQMLAGSLTPQVVNFLLAPGGTPYQGGDGLLPADVDGNTWPPLGAPELFIGSMDNGGPYGAPQDALNVFRFHVDWAVPANSTFTGPTVVPVAAFDSTFTPCGGGRTCIPQPGTANKIDILSYRQRPTFRAAYRNFGTHESVALSQSVSGLNSGTASAIAGMRWYELRDPNGTPTLYQQGTYVPNDGAHRWMGSIAMDRVGNMGLGFSASNATTVYPSSFYTGRLVTDPLGTMPQGEASAGTGTGSQTSGNRWGDYTSMNIDPVDDCTFWYFNEYYTASGTNWIMRTGSFTFPSCLCASTPAAPTTTSATASASNQITVNWNDAAAASITQYYLFRSTVAGGPYGQIATIPDTSPGVGGSGTYFYDNTGVSGGTRYYYVVKANDGISCTSANSNEVNALATGPCLLAPTFAGVTSVTNPTLATCTLNLAWATGTSNCAGSLSYNIYRSTTTPFTPAGGNRIAASVGGTGYTDSAALVSGTPYYYIVRAVDSPSGVEDANLVTLSATPTGGVTTSNLADTFEGALSGGGFDLAGWTHNFIGGSVDWAWSTTQSQTPTHSWRSASQTTTSDRVLTSPSFGVVASTTMTFYHTYDFEGSTSTCYDGGTLETSPDGTVWTVVPDADFTVGAFTGTVNSGFGNAIGGKRAWCDGTIGAMTQVSVNLGADANLLNKNIRVRWHEGDDSSAIANGWYVDSIAINNAGTASACTTALPGPPGVPNGVSGTAMKGTKVDASATNITVTWDPGCAGSNYEIVYGTNAQLPTAYGNTYGLTGVTCNLGNTGSANWNPAPAIPGGSSFLWWLVVATDGSTTEGSWSSNTSQERTGPGAGGSSQGATGACSTTKSLANTCGQ